MKAVNVYVYKLFEISKNQVIVLVKGKLPPFHMTGVLSLRQGSHLLRRDSHLAR